MFCVSGQVRQLHRGPFIYRLNFSCPLASVIVSLCSVFSDEFGETMICEQTSKIRVSNSWASVRFSFIHIVQ